MKRRTDLVDWCGLPLTEQREWLAPRAADFPTPKAMKNPQAVREWRQRWAGTPCWWCGRMTDEAPASPRHGEAHHIVRHDAPWAFAWLCASCHRIREASAAAPANLHDLLRLKHQHDHQHAIWVMLAIGRGRFLPTE